jgi:transcriptional regulator of arginine metabolism
MDKKKSSILAEALRELLLNREASTQDDICHVLEKKGFEINQSKVSRLLRKIGAIKIVNNQGQTVYTLLREPAPPSPQTKLRDLIIDVVHNENLVLIFTSPGSASMVARMLDYAQVTSEILGTIAGDDTIFVAPKSVKDIKKLHDDIKTLLIA